MAYLEGAMEAAAARQFEARMAAEPALRQEYEAYEALGKALEDYGRALARKTPPVDLAAAVMAEIMGDSSGDRIVSLDSRKRRVRMWMGFAAAAGVLIVAALALLARPDASTLGPAYTENTATPGADPHTAVTPEQDFEMASDTPQNPLLEIDPSRVVPLHGNMERVTPPVITLPDSGQILATLREASPEEAWQQVHEWATPTAGQAKALADNPNASLGAVVGVAPYLDDTEAQIALLRAEGELTGQPYLHFALYTRQGSEPSAQASIAQEVVAIKKLDPHNALSYYMEAKMLLDQGDVAGALASLALAREMPAATGYSLQAAAYHEEALLAQGYDDETARLLAALTVGENQHDLLCDLAGSLLDYGTQFVQQGELDTAFQIMGAVAQLGEQLNDTSPSLRERLAGSEIQRATLDVVQDILTQFEPSSADTEAWGQVADSLLLNVDELQGWFEMFDSLISGDGTQGFFDDVAQFILGNGEVPLLQGLQNVDLSTLRDLQTGEADLFDFLDDVGEIVNAFAPEETAPDE